MEVVRYLAAGGVVVRDGQVLVLYRPGSGEVRLPKGHVEKGESAPEAALREVAEESGYDDLEIVADLGEQVVEFDYKDRHFVRRERYFLMRPRDPSCDKHSPAERQFIPAWLSWEDALAKLTFPAERAWVRRAMEMVARKASTT